MPNIKSAIKRMRSDKKVYGRNQVVLSELKTLDKKLFNQMKDPKEAAEFSRKIFSRYDSAVSKGVIPKGRADRKKSRIAQFLKTLKKK